MSDEPLMLALDLATVTGWAAAPLRARPVSALEAKAGQGYTPLSGTHQIAAPGTAIGPFGRAYHVWFQSLLARLGSVEVVVFEAPILPRKTTLMTIRKLHGLCYHTEVMAFAAGLRCYESDRGEVVKHFCGYKPKGRAEQKAAVLKMCRVMSWKARDDNEADALATLDHGLAHWNKRIAA